MSIINQNTPTCKQWQKIQTKTRVNHYAKHANMQTMAKNKYTNTTVLQHVSIIKRKTCQSLSKTHQHANNGKKYKHKHMSTIMRNTPTCKQWQKTKIQTQQFYNTCQSLSETHHYANNGKNKHIN